MLNKQGPEEGPDNRILKAVKEGKDANNQRGGLSKKFVITPHSTL